MNYQMDWLTLALLLVVLGGTTLTALTLGIGCWCYCRKDKKKDVPKGDNVLMLTDKVDHMWSVFDLFSPKVDAFDRPFEVCKKIKEMAPDRPIKLVLCTNGGNVVHCEKMLKQLRKHPRGYVAYIKNECFSAGTILALGATEIVMKDDSYLGKIDPQISSMLTSYSAVLYNDLPPNCITDHTIDKVRLSEWVLNYMRELLDIIYPEDSAVREKVVQNMIYSPLPHFKTFDSEACCKIGLNIREPTSEELELFVDAT